jgi:SAM-dependent methyltransferase
MNLSGWLRPKLEFHQHRYARGLDEVVTKQCRWLDIGAGTKLHDGWLGRSQQDLSADAGILVGCDMVREHLRRNPYLTAALGASVYALPLESGSFDVVSANMVLEHLDDPPTAFAEIARVLRPGGVFVFITPNVRNPIIGTASVLLHRRVRRIAANIVESRDMEHIFPTYYRANSTSAISSLAHKVGLRPEVLDVFNTGPFVAKPAAIRGLELLYLNVLSRVAPQRGTNIFGALVKQPH